MANLNATGAKSTKRSARTKVARKPASHLSITDIALAMAEVHKLTAILDKGGTVAGVVERKCVAGSQPQHDASIVSFNCGAQGDTMQERLEALAGTLFQLDPATPSEVLSLALVLQMELDGFIATYTDPANDEDARRAGDMIDRAYRAVVLGLVRHVGLTSLISSRYTPRTHVSSIEQATMAAHRAAPYLTMTPDKIDKLAVSSQAMPWTLTRRCLPPSAVS